MGASRNVIEFNEANFDAEVLASSQPVLVDFWAEWCQPCRALGPIIDAVADESAGKAKVGKIDIDVNRDLAARFGITAIPTVLIFKEGKAVKRFSGITKKDVLAAALSEASS
jgi:thioredoxin 1